MGSARPGPLRTAWAVLKRNAELAEPLANGVGGGEVFVLARVGANFDDLGQWARRAGYAEAVYIENRARVFYSVPEEL